MTETTKDWIDDAIDRVLDASTNNFVELVKIAELDPGVDFQFRDLTGMDLSSQDLAGFNFSGSRMTGCSFFGARIKAAKFTGALYEPGALQAALDWDEWSNNDGGPMRPQSLAELSLSSSMLDSNREGNKDGGLSVGYDELADAIQSALISIYGDKPSQPATANEDNLSPQDVILNYFSLKEPLDAAQPLAAQFEERIALHDPKADLASADGKQQTAKQRRLWDWVRGLLRAKPRV